jgi:hypothetical protein
MRKFHFLAAALAVSAAPAVLAAQGGDAAKAAPAKPAGDAAKPDPQKVADVQRAAIILRTFSLAFESKDVQQPIKGALLACLYNNKLSEITAATNRALASEAKPDAGAIYRAAAGACGITFKKTDTAGPAAGAKPAPKPSGDSR